jgi:hypothetical protein
MRTAGSGREEITGDSDPALDPMALEPLGPMGWEPGRAELAGPLALDPLSPIGRDATDALGARVGDPRPGRQQKEGTS